MWLLLGDFADVVGLKIYKTIRIVSCCVIAAACIGLCFAAYGKAGKSSVAFAENEQTIMQLRDDLSEYKRQAEEIQSAPEDEYYEPSGVCEKIAELQTAYGDYGAGSSIQDISMKSKETMEALDEYITSGASSVQWFTAPAQNYEWRFLNYADSAVSSVPVAWECTGTDGKIYAVCFGTFDGNSMRCGQFDIHITHDGYLLTDEAADAVSNDEDEAADVEGIQSGVSDNLSDEEKSESGSEDSSSDDAQAGTEEIMKKSPSDLPEGYYDEDRASEADVSLENNTPVCTETEARYAEKLNKDMQKKFYGLNHKARDRFMSENPLPASGSQTETVKPQVSAQSAPAVPSPQSPGTGTQKLTNEEVLQSILQ